MTWSSLFPLLLLLPPLLLALGAVANRGQEPLRAWLWAQRVALASLLISAVLLTLGLSGLLPRTGTWWQAAPLNLIMLLLANFMGFVVLRYSATYLKGEPREQRFAGLVQALFAAVGVAVVSNHLLLFLTAWLSISLAMHQLLMFYPERPRAALAAHKKFLFARAAELCALIAFALLYLHHDTAQISVITSAYTDSPASLSASERTAAILIALAALIKCAQLPLHGWLIQVVEAPTPVSAALHGGVINLGGYLLLMFSPLILNTTSAQILIFLVAGTSCVLAVLIMMTRISVKVRLAWSTSAQMGLMLVEIALGLLELALLHLLAHSFYKAYAFLSSGEAVQQDLQRRQAPAARPSFGQWCSAAALSVSLVVGLGVLVTQLSDSTAFQSASPWVLLTLALTTLLAERSGHPSVGSHGLSLGFAAVVAGTYLTFKSILSGVFPVHYSTPGWADFWVSTLFVLLFIGYYLQRYGLHYPRIRTLNTYLYAGFYLDEWVTKTTLRLWPHPLPARIRAKQLQPESREVSL